MISSRPRLRPSSRNCPFRCRNHCLPPTPLLGLLPFSSFNSRRLRLLIHDQHAILVSYHSALDAANLQRNITPPDDFLNKTGTRMAPSHIRHCFDYIRQTIMCAADTNLEVLDHETHKTSGWGQPRICRDYGSVFNWAEKWANSSDTGLIT
jgi:hypothetical protein